MLVISPKIEMNSDPSVMFESEKDDDIFYAEIRKQILLLTSEEDNEVFLESKQFNPIRVGNSGPNRSIYGFPNASIPASLFCYWESDNSGSPPVRLVNLWKNGNGTGLFIPQTVKCRRNYRTGKKKSSRKIYKDQWRMNGSIYSFQVCI